MKTLKFDLNIGDEFDINGTYHVTKEEYEEFLKMVEVIKLNEYTMTMYLGNMEQDVYSNEVEDMFCVVDGKSGEHGEGYGYSFYEMIEEAYEEVKDITDEDRAKENDRVLENKLGLIEYVLKLQDIKYDIKYDNEERSSLTISFKDFPKQRIRLSVEKDYGSLKACATYNGNQRGFRLNHWSDYRYEVKMIVEYMDLDLKLPMDMSAFDKAQDFAYDTEPYDVGGKYENSNFGYLIKNLSKEIEDNLSSGIVLPVIQETVDKFKQIIQNRKVAELEDLNATLKEIKDGLDDEYVLLNTSTKEELLNLMSDTGFLRGRITKLKNLPYLIETIAEKKKEL